MTAAEFVTAILVRYSDRPDDHVLSLGHWVTPEGHLLASDNERADAKFSAQIKVTLGELRAMSD